MVQIYNEITIYIYKVIFPSGDTAPEPPLGALFLPDPPAGRIAPLDPAEGVHSFALPYVEEVYILLGCKYFMGYKHG